MVPSGARRQLPRAGGVWRRSVALLRRRKQRALAPSFCRCPAVRLRRWRSERAPGPQLSSSPSGIAAGSRVARWEPRESGGPGDVPWERQPRFWAGAGQNGCWGGRGWGPRGGWQLPGSQRSQFCPWWRAGSGLGSPAFVRVPRHRKNSSCRRDGRNCKASGGGEGKAEPAGAEPAAALTAGRARRARFRFPRAGGHAARAPRLLARLVGSAGPSQPAVSLPAWPHGAGEAAVGSSRFSLPAPPHPLDRARAGKLSLTSLKN